MKSLGITCVLSIIVVRAMVPMLLSSSTSNWSMHSFMVQSSMKPWWKTYILEKKKKMNINRIESFHYVLSNIIYLYIFPYSPSSSLIISVCILHQYFPYTIPTDHHIIATLISMCLPDPPYLLLNFFSYLTSYSYHQF